VQIISDITHAESQALSAALIDEFHLINDIRAGREHKFFMADGRDVPLDRGIEFTTEAKRGIIKRYLATCGIDSSGGVMCTVFRGV
jgi:hypothetical protein